MKPPKATKVPYKSSIHNIDRIDNDGDGEINGPIITEEMISGEEIGARFESD